MPAPVSDDARTGLGGDVPPATPIAASVERRRDLDLIRAAVVGGLVFYHTALLFPVGFSASRNPASLVLTVGVVFAQLWGMPLLFVVAGSGVWHSLGTRSPGRFARERLTRLLVPLITGMVLVVPPQIYYAMRFQGVDPGPYWQFLLRFFDVRPVARFPAFLEGSGPDPQFHLAHLWFLYYLLVWSLVLLPVFLYLRGPAGQRLVQWLADRCQGPSGIVLLAIPIAVLEAVLGTWKLGGWNSYSYLVFLLYGYALAADRGLREALRRRWAQSLAIGLALLPVLLVIASSDLGNADRVVALDPDLWSVVWRALKATAGWALTAGLIGLAAGVTRRRAREEPSPPRRRWSWEVAAGYAREAVLPFYVLHQTPVVILGFYVLQWDTNLLVKYLAISLGALAATLCLYDLLVRRTRVTRVLFGMPAKAATWSASPSSSETSGR
jgi:glucan biosynthesis protein C